MQEGFAEIKRNANAISVSLSGTAGHSPETGCVGIALGTSGIIPVEDARGT
ncbi:MAG: hypothetical protein R2741_03255 [Methanolobus sp.]